MADSRFWRLCTVLMILGLFYVGHGLHSGRALPMPSPENAAHASVGVATESAEVVFTASQDGKKIYSWQYFRAKPPRFLGEAEAILSR